MRIVIHWTRSSIGHIARHGVRAREAEKALQDKHLFHWRARYKGVICDYFLGHSFGRLLVLITEYDEKSQKFTIRTVRDATGREKKLYKKKM